MAFAIAVGCWTVGWCYWASDIDSGRNMRLVAKRFLLLFVWALGGVVSCLSFFRGILRGT